MVEVTFSERPDVVEFTVADRGMGIDELTAGRMFEAFGRGDAVEHVQGLGLGLHITQQIVELHGGDHRRVALGRSGRDRHRPAATDPSDVDVTTPRRILVVEDDPSLRETLAEVLEDDGHEVRVAEDGEAALEAIHEWTPELIVLDLMMPRMDGYAFRQAQRAACGNRRDEDSPAVGRAPGGGGGRGAPGRRVARQALRPA